GADQGLRPQRRLAGGNPAGRLFGERGAPFLWLGSQGAGSRRARISGPMAGGTRPETLSRALRESGARMIHDAAVIPPSLVDMDSGLAASLRYAAPRDDGSHLSNDPRLLARSFV